MIILFIGSLWGIGLRDEKLLKEAKIEANITKDLYNQAVKINSIFDTFDNGKIPEEVMEIGVSLLEIMISMYTETMSSLNLYAR